jgi:methylglutaconyl-CoA hydratase
VTVRAHRLPPPGTHLAEIVLDRPEKRNALTPGMLRAIRDRLAELEADEAARAIILRGEGKAFCAGFDLDLCRENSDALRDLLTELSLTIRALRRSPKPIVIGAHGAAIAGGCALLAGADLVVTHRDAKLGYPVVRLGISPSVNAPAFRAAVGDRAARLHLLGANLFDGVRAHDIGLAALCVDLAEDVVPRAQLEADKLASKPPGAFAATKDWLNEVDGSLDDEAFDEALRVSLSLVGADEERAALERMWAARDQSSRTADQQNSR